MFCNCLSKFLNLLINNSSGEIMPLFREKEIFVVNKHFRGCYSEKTNQRNLPFVLMGREIGVGHRIIIKQIKKEKDLFNLSLSLNCSEYIMDGYFDIYQLLKFLTDIDIVEDKILCDYIDNWISMFESELDLVMDENIFFNKVIDYIFVFTIKRPLLITIENIHFGSKQFLDLLILLSQRVEKNLGTVNFSSKIYLLGFYKLEEFLDISLKYFFVNITEKGLAFKIRNYYSKDFFEIVAPYFKSLNKKSAIEKIWYITAGNVLVFISVIDYLMKKLEEKGEIDKNKKDKRIDEDFIISILPDDKYQFYELLISELSKIELKVLEFISFFSSAIDDDFLKKLLGNGIKNKQYQSTIKNLIDYKYIYEVSNTQKRKFNISSIDFKKHITTRASFDYQKEISTEILVVFEKFYIDNIERNLLLLKKLSTASLNKEKTKFYLFLLLKTLPKNSNYFRTIEVLEHLILLDSDNEAKALYVIDYSNILVYLQKLRSASDLLERYFKELKVSKETRFNLFLQMLNIYLISENFYKADKLINLYTENFKEVLSDSNNEKYYTWMSKFLYLSQRYTEAIEIANEGLKVVDNKEKLFLSKANSLFRLGFLSQSRSIYKSIFKYVKDKNKANLSCYILYKMGKIEFISCDFKKAKVLYDSSLELANRLNDDRLKVKIMTALAFYHEKISETKKALKLIYETLNISEGLNCNTSELYRFLTLYYMKVNNFDKALSCAKFAKKSYQGKSNINKRIDYTLLLAECYYNFNKEDLGKKVYSEIIGLNARNKNPFISDKIKLSMARSFISINEIDRANKFLKQANKSSSHIPFIYERQLLKMRIADILDKNKTKERIKDDLLVKLPEDYSNKIIFDLREYGIYL